MRSRRIARTGSRAPTRRRPRLAGGLLVLAALLVVNVSAVGRVRGVCPTRQAHVVLADAAVRVVRVREHTSRGASYSRLFACSSSPERSYALDDPNPEHEGRRAVRVVLAGRFAAWGSSIRAVTRRS